MEFGLTLPIKALHMCIPTQKFQNMVDLHIAIRSTIKIDNQSKEIFQRIKKLAAGKIYTVLIVEIDFEVDLPR